MHETIALDFNNRSAHQKVSSTRSLSCRCSSAERRVARLLLNFTIAAMLGCITTCSDRVDLARDLSCHRSGAQICTRAHTQRAHHPHQNTHMVSEITMLCDARCTDFERMFFGSSWINQFATSTLLYISYVLFASQSERGRVPSPDSIANRLSDDVCSLCAISLQCMLGTYA